MTPKEKALEKKLKEFIKDIGEQKQIVTLIFDDKNCVEEINLDMQYFIDFIKQETKKEMIEKIESKGDDIIRVKDLLEELEESKPNGG